MIAEGGRESVKPQSCTADHRGDRLVGRRMLLMEQQPFVNFTGRFVFLLFATASADWHNIPR